MTTASAIDCIVPSEAVQLYGNLNDWHDAVGTGPFILQDFVDSSSMTLVKNPNYWGTDERYPQNKLPYVNELEYLIIPNTATALTAMRVGKIDEINGATITNNVVKQMKLSNPKINSISTESAALDLEPKDNVAPFNNINVRIAAQEALDLATIASTYYQGTANPMPQTLTSYYITGWGWPYPDWPASLQAEYAYNPTNAKALLAAAGYPNGFNTTLYADSTLDMSMLEIVQSYEAAIGINITIQPMLFASLTAFLGSPVYNAGMCERSSGLIGRTLAPLRVLTQFVPGNSVNFEDWNDPAYNFVSLANAATTIDAIKQVDQQANQYVAQQHIVICLDTPNAFSLVQPWLFGYNGQVNAFQFLVNTYAARFWIDQS
jgi:ABC-type transport system substrate-binding protein